MATCPKCKTSSRVEPGALVVEEVLVAKPVGTYSLSGTQMKASASPRLRLRCTKCGWSVLGHIEGDSFVADPVEPDAQVGTVVHRDSKTVTVDFPDEEQTDG